MVQAGGAGTVRRGSPGPVSGAVPAGSGAPRTRCPGPAAVAAARNDDPFVRIRTGRAPGAALGTPRTGDEAVRSLAFAGTAQNRGVMGDE